MSYFFDDIKPYDNRDMSSSDDDVSTSNKLLNQEKPSQFDQYSSDEDGDAPKEESVLPVRDYEESENESSDKEDENSFESEPEEELVNKAIKKTSFKKLKNLQDEFDKENKKSGKKTSKLQASGETLEDIKQQLMLHKQSFSKLKKIEKKSKYDIPEEFDRSDSGSDIGEGNFFEEEDDMSDGDAPAEQSFKRNGNSKKKQNKHAPREEKMSKKISFIRDVPGLDDFDRRERAKEKQNDIRFDKALGDNNVDYHKIRNNYKFLDEYRDQEIKRMRGLLRDKKELAKLEEYQVDEIRGNLQKMENKMYTLKQKDKEHDFIKKYQDEINMKNQNRTSGNKFYLKESDKRKLLNKFKFENMDTRQRNKVMERKRKRQLGKEMKMFGQ
ncbi:hypothetical protein QEN19_003083 [Hanseniaspora menglaensis]